MSPDEIKAARQEVSATTREFATAVGVDQDTVLSWERGETFPTKKHVDRIRAIVVQGSGAIVKTPKRGAVKTPMQLLGDAPTWKLFRKILAHAELRAACEKLAENHPDPLDDAPKKSD